MDRHRLPKKAWQPVPLSLTAGWRGARSCRHENVVDLEIIHDLMLRRKKAETNKFLPLLHDGNVLVHAGSTMWRDRLRNGRRHPIPDSVPGSQRNVGPSIRRQRRRCLLCHVCASDGGDNSEEGKKARTPQKLTVTPSDAQYVFCVRQRRHKASTTVENAGSAPIRVRTHKDT